MDLLFVGTGAADIASPLSCPCATCTAIRRRGARNLRHYSSLLVDGTILLDCGPTVPWRLGELDVPPAQIEALVVTHSHEDHLDLGAVTDLLQARGDRRGPLPVYGNAAALAALAPLAERLELHEATPGCEERVLGRRFLPVQANHIPDEETALNWLIGGDGGWILYGTDTGWPLPETWATLRREGLAGAIVEATFGLDSSHPDFLTHHLNWPEFLRLREALVAEAILSPEAPYIATHLSLHYAPLHDDLSPQATLPVVVAYDGLRMRI